MRTIIGIDEELMAEATMPRAMRQGSNGAKQRCEATVEEGLRLPVSVEVQQRAPNARHGRIEPECSRTPRVATHDPGRHLGLDNCMGRRFSPVSQRPDKPGQDQIVPGRREPADFVRRTREARQPRFVEAAVARLRMAVLRGEYIAGLAAPDERQPRRRRATMRRHPRHPDA
jgi:hypothetical protein